MESVGVQWLNSSEPGGVSAGNGGAASPTNGNGPIEVSDVLDEESVARLRDTHSLEMRETLCDAFARSLPTCVDAIVDAAGRGDADELRRAAHMLRGSSATLGAMRLSQACEQLERAGRTEDPPIERPELDQFRSLAEASMHALREQLLLSGVAS